MANFSPAAFQDACRTSGPLRLDVAGAGSPDGRITLPQPFAILGSHSGAHVRLLDPRLSRRHAYLQIIDGRTFCLDLESRTGTRWGTDIRSSGWITAGQALTIGDRTIRVAQPRCADEPLLSPLSADSWSHHFPPLTLKITCDGKRPTHWTANRILFLIGKSDVCKIRLHSPEISRIHASVIYTSQGIWVVDLLSRSGVFLNGERIKAARVESGDELRLGRFQIQLDMQGPPDAANRGPGQNLRHPPIDLPALLPTIAGAANSPCQSMSEGRLDAVRAGNLSSVRTVLDMPKPHADSGPVASLLPIIGQFSWMQTMMFERFQENLLELFRMFQVNQQGQMGLIREELSKLQEVTRKLADLRKELTTIEDRPQASPSQLPAALANRPQRAPDKGANGRQHLSGTSSPKNLPSQEVHAWLCERLATLQNESQNRWQRIMSFLAGKA